MSNSKKVIKIDSYKKQKNYNVNESITKVTNNTYIEPFFKLNFEDYLKKIADLKQYSSEQHFFESVKNNLKGSHDPIHKHLIYRIKELGY